MYSIFRANKKVEGINNTIKYLLKTLPLIILVGGVLLFFLYGKELTLEQMLDYSPQNELLAIVFILLMFILKSFSVIFPVSMIYIVVGIIFPPILAVIINVMGISIGFSCAYSIGFFSRKDIKKQLIMKYPKLYKIDVLLKNNELFFTFLVRTAGILPMDVVSIFMGLISMPFRKYLIASVLGILPVLLVTTVIGATITNPKSPEFILSILARIIISVISIFIYRKTLKKKLL